MIFWILHFWFSLYQKDPSGFKKNVVLGITDKGIKLERKTCSYASFMVQLNLRLSSSRHDFWGILHGFKRIRLQPCSRPEYLRIKWLVSCPSYPLTNTTAYIPPALTTTTASGLSCNRFIRIRLLVSFSPKYLTFTTAYISPLTITTTLTSSNLPWTSTIAYKSPSTH